MKDAFTPDRRAFVGGLGAMLAAGAAPAVAQEPLPLWRAAAQAGLLFGAAGGPEVFTEAAISALHQRHSRLFVHENAMKLPALRPEADKPNYTHAEALLSYAEKNGMLSQGTALVWNDDLPGWLKGRSSQEVARLLDAHLEATCAKFYGRFHSYGVVNEPIFPLHHKPNGYRDGPFYAALGEDYIFRAFKRVAAVDPTTKLFLNEAWCEQEDAPGMKGLGPQVRAHLLTLIDKMLDRGLKLDAVGLEAHLHSTQRWDPEAFSRFLEELSKRKLKIWITELDVDDQRFARELTKRDLQVADLTTEFLRVALANKDVEMVVTWGLSDKTSFLRDPAVAKARARDFPARPLPFDDEAREKPMARALRAGFLAAPARA